MNPRKLKIHYKFRQRKYDTSIIPLIRLEGKWLENLGFKIGNEITVNQKINKLIITVKKNTIAK